LKGRVLAAPAGGAALDLSIPRTAGALALKLSFNTNSGSASGTLGLGASTATLDIKRTVDAPSAVGLAAVYNTRLRAPAGANIPQGSGWIRVSATRSGEATITGKLADGAILSFGSVITADRKLALFAPLYKGHGSLLGSPTLSPATPAELTGSLDWRKFAAADTKDFSYLDGINASLPALGRPFKPPVAGTIMLGLPNAANNARIEFTGAGLSSAAMGGSVNQTFRLLADGTSRFAVAPGNPCVVQFFVDLTLGTFTGSFQLRDGTALRRSYLSGIFVPGETTAEGQFTLPQIPDPATADVLSGLVKLKAP
jgi:hypothetical protein